MHFSVSLRDLYVGRRVALTRVKGVYKETAGKRQCNCRLKTVTKQLGPGMFQQYQMQVRTAAHVILLCYGLGMPQQHHMLSQSADI